MVTNGSSRGKKTTFSHEKIVSLNKITQSKSATQKMLRKICVTKNRKSNEQPIVFYRTEYRRKMNAYSSLKMFNKLFRFEFQPLENSTPFSEKTLNLKIFGKLQSRFVLFLISGRWPKNTKDVIRFFVTQVFVVFIFFRVPHYFTTSIFWSFEQVSNILNKLIYHNLLQQKLS